MRHDSILSHLFKAHSFKVRVSNPGIIYATRNYTPPPINVYSL